jgi:glycosyltransferase involved in cell wall biosynthesis
MQNHALAAAQSGRKVRLIGLAGSECAPEVESHPDIQIQRLPDRLARRSAGFGALRGALRVVVQHFQLLRTLFDSKDLDTIVVQSPPAIPTLVVAAWIARRRAIRWVIDWHNFSYAMLGASLGKQHPIARGVRVWERALGRRADAHLCVSRAMADQLTDSFGIRDPQVLYDRPMPRFSPVPDRERRARLQSLLRRYLPDSLEGGLPACLVCPTSWSDDDDLPLLIEALVAFDRRLCDGDAGGAPVCVLLTGRGPGRAGFADRIRNLTLHRVRIEAVWVSAEDYPELLACADLGVCVHRSASGVDLPMKIVDLIGAGTPVCALDYGPCLSEQVRDGDGAVFFSDADELARRLAELFADFPEKTPNLDRLREAICGERSRTPKWQADWSAIADPVLFPSSDSGALRIALFHPDFGLGGAERWLVDAALALQDAGHRVCVITSRFDPNRSFEAARDGRLDVRVRGDAWPAAIGGRLRAPCAIARSALAVLSSALRGERYDVVCIDLVPHVIPLLSGLGRPKVVYYCHHPDQLMARAGRGASRGYEIYRAPIDSLEIRAARNADRVLVNSHFTRDAAQRVYGLADSSLELVQPGIELGSEPPPRDAACAHGAIPLLCVGRFDPEKRFVCAVEAVGLLVKRIDPSIGRRIQLVIAGGFDAAQPECSRAVDELQRSAGLAGIRDQLTLLKSPTDERLGELFADCRCLVHPAVDEHFGIVPLEAMRASRAVIACRSGGPRETVVDGETGLLCDADADAFAAAIERLVCDAELADAMGQAGRARVAAEFSVEIFANRLRSIVSQVSA